MNEKEKILHVLQQRRGVGYHVDTLLKKTQLSDQDLRPALAELVRTRAVEVKLSERDLQPVYGVIRERTTTSN